MKKKKPAGSLNLHATRLGIGISPARQPPPTHSDRAAAATNKSKPDASGIKAQHIIYNPIHSDLRARVYRLGSFRCLQPHELLSVPAS
jgi:hypothetical protein